MTDGEPETVVSASLQKIKSIKNPIKHFVNFVISLNLKLVTHFGGWVPESDAGFERVSVGSVCVCVCLCGVCVVCVCVCVCVCV